MSDQPPQPPHRVGHRRAPDLRATVQVTLYCPMSGTQAIQPSVACWYCQAGGVRAQAHAHVSPRGQGGPPTLTPWAAVQAENIGVMCTVIPVCHHCVPSLCAITVCHHCVQSLCAIMVAITAADHCSQSLQPVTQHKQYNNISTAGDAGHTHLSVHPRS
jgi:hypothetical protein